MFKYKEGLEPVVKPKKKPIGFTQSVVHYPGLTGKKKLNFHTHLGDLPSEQQLFWIDNIVATGELYSDSSMNTLLCGRFHFDLGSESKTFNINFNDIGVAIDHEYYDEIGYYDEFQDRIRNMDSFKEHKAGLWSCRMFYGNKAIIGEMQKKSKYLLTC